MKPHKISTHSAYSDNCYFPFFYRLSVWVEILWGFTKFYFKQMLKVSAFYLKKQNSFIPKKYFIGRCQYENEKALFNDPIFSEGFDPDLRLSSIFDSITLSGVGIVKFEVFISVASKKGLGLFWLDSYEREEHALFSNISLRFLNSNLNPNSSDVL